MTMLEKGYIQIYTGYGKGKTTAAVGLTIRALGAGLKVAFLQFFKPATSSEIKILKQFSPQLFYANFHTEGFVKGAPSEALKREIEKGVQLFKRLLEENSYDLCVLDEFTYALNWKIIDLERVLNLLREKPKNMEIVITGREASEELLSLADLVTVMHPLKHYFEKGVEARWGIEK